MNNIKNLGATRRVHILLQGATAYASLMLFVYLNVFCLIVGYRKKNSLANMLFHCITSSNYVHCRAVKQPAREFFSFSLA